MAIRPRETITQPEIKEIELNKKDKPWDQLKSLGLKKDFETLQKTPINQPMVEFLEDSSRIVEDMNYDNEHEIKELQNEFNFWTSKEYNKDLPITICAIRLKAIYEKQIFKLMEFPDLGARAILDMYKIHKKLKGEEYG